MITKILLITISINLCRSSEERVVYTFKPVYQQHGKERYVIQNSNEIPREPAPIHEEEEPLRGSNKPPGISYYYPKESVESYAEYKQPLSYTPYYQEPHVKQEEHYQQLEYPTHNVKTPEVKYHYAPTKSHGSLDVKIPENKIRYHYVPAKYSDGSLDVKTPDVQTKYHYAPSQYSHESQDVNTPETETKYHYVPAKLYEETQSHYHEADSHTNDNPVDYYSHPKYEYGYNVDDPHTGDNKYQHEYRDGDTVRGVYALQEPDGSIRTVEYSSDKDKGFHAVVKHTSPSEHLHVKSQHED